MQVLGETAAVMADRCLPYSATDAPLSWRPAQLIDDHWGTTDRAADALAGLLSISVSEALARLRASAFTTGRPLPALAREVLRHRRGWPHEEGQRRPGAVRDAHRYAVNSGSSQREWRLPARRPTMIPSAICVRSSSADSSWDIRSQPVSGSNRVGHAAVQDVPGSRS